MTEALATTDPSRTLARRADISVKAGLFLLLGLALAYPDLSHMREKAAPLRAVAYPMMSFAVPVAWLLLRRAKWGSFPWVPDLLVTLTCFSDILGNRLDLYDSVVWFDDWMHFANTGLLTAAVLLLVPPTKATLAAVIERAVAFGVTAAVVWEFAEYFAFLSVSSERSGAYADTLGDLALGTLGAITAGVVIFECCHRRQRALGARDVPMGSVARARSAVRSPRVTERSATAKSPLGRPARPWASCPVATTYGLEAQ